jgi:hypothetical protein
MQKRRVFTIAGVLAVFLFTWQYLTWSTFSPNPFWFSDTWPYSTYTRVRVGQAGAQCLYFLYPLAKLPFGAAIERASRLQGRHWGARIYAFCYGSNVPTTIEAEVASRRQGAFRLALLNATSWWLALVGAYLAVRTRLNRRGAA